MNYGGTTPTRTCGKHNEIYPEDGFCSGCAMEQQSQAGKLDATLAERGSRYGKFISHATITQRLKDIIRANLAYQDKKLTDDQQEALDMICHKIGRIINGDPDYADSWIDIAG
jgi:hypothetical protein